VALIW